MSGHKSAIGDIPDEWFENDTEPDAGKGTESDGFVDRFLEKIDPSLREQPPQKPR